jgi:lipopolysaccharide export LptBFGC system permease protein LptF
MKAAGVSTRRTVAPVLLCSLVIGALAAANQELLLPRLEGKIRQVDFEGRKVGNVSTSLWVYDEERRTTIDAEKIDTAVEGKELRRIEAVADAQFGPDGNPLPAASLRAERAVWAGRWLFLFDGHTTDARGAERPFAIRILRTDATALEFKPPAKPTGRLADGTRAHNIRARADLPALKFALPDTAATGAEPLHDPLGGQPLTLQFARVELTGRYRMFFNGHITESYAGEETQPPIAVRAALWHEGRWVARAQTYTEVARNSSHARRRLIVYDGHPLPISATPAELVQAKIDPSLKSFAYLLAKARENPRNRRLCQRIYVLLHGRLAFPLANFVLLIVAIPLLFQQEGGKGTWIGVGLALVVSASFYFFTYFCQFAGQDPQGVFAGIPAVAAWLPVGVFSIGGGVLLANINT